MFVSADWDAVISKHWLDKNSTHFAMQTAATVLIEAQCGAETQDVWQCMEDSTGISTPNPQKPSLIHRTSQESTKDAPALELYRPSCDSSMQGLKMTQMPADSKAPGSIAKSMLNITNWIRGCEAHGCKHGGAEKSCLCLFLTGSLRFQLRNW